MEILDNSLRAMSLKDKKELIKNLKLRNVLPKQYSKLNNEQLYEELKKHVKLRKDSENLYVVRVDEKLHELKPKPVRSRAPRSDANEVKKKVPKTRTKEEPVIESKKMIQEAVAPKQKKQKKKEEPLEKVQSPSDSDTDVKEVTVKKGVVREIVKKFSPQTVKQEPKTKLTSKRVKQIDETA